MKMTQLLDVQNFPLWIFDLRRGEESTVKIFLFQPPAGTKGRKKYDSLLPGEATPTSHWSGIFNYIPVFLGYKQNIG